MRRALIALAVLAACSDTSILEVPSPPTGAGTILLLRIGDGTDPENAEAVATTVPVGRFEEIEGVEYDTALYFAAIPSALGWPEGKRLFHTLATGTHLVRPLAAHARDATGEWREAPERIDAAAVRRFRLPSLAGAPCAALTACFEGDPLVDASLFCAPTCPDAVDVAPPAPPRATCPSGFDAITDLGITACTATVTACPRHQRRVIGGGCATIGAACALEGGIWPATIPAGNVRYVSSIGDAFGDGTRARPWDFETAIARADSGDVLVLSAGHHSSSTFIQLHRSLTFVGPCASLAKLEIDSWTIWAPIAFSGLAIQAGYLHTPPAGSMSFTGASVAVVQRISSVGGRLSFQDSTLTASAPPSLLDLNGGARLLLEDTDVDDTQINLDTSSATVTRSVLTRGPPCIIAFERSTLVVSESLFTGMPSNSSALIAVRGADVSITRSVLSGTASGLDIDEPSSITLDEVWITGQSTAAIVFRSKMNATLTARDLVVRSSAAGIYTLGGTEVRLERSAFFHVQAAFDVTAGATFEASDLTIRGTTDTAISFRARGAAPFPVTLSRVAIEGGVGSGIYADGSTQLTATDLHIARVADRPAPNPVGGSGLVLFGGPRAEISNLSIDEISDIGIDSDGISTIFVRNGLVAAGRVALFYQGADDWRDHFDQVRFTASAPVEAPR